MESTTPIQNHHRVMTKINAIRMTPHIGKIKIASLKPQFIFRIDVGGKNGARARGDITVRVDEIILVNHVAESKITNGKNKWRRDETDDRARTNFHQ